MNPDHFKACSLTRSDGVQLRHCDIQLIPHESDPLLASVYSQRGLSTSKPIPRVCCENVPLDQARAVYRSHRDATVLKQGYSETGLSRESLAQSKRMAKLQQHAALVMFDGSRFDWPEALRDMVTEVERATGIPEGSTWQQETPLAVATLMLADVSFGLAEGPHELIAEINKAGGGFAGVNGYRRLSSALASGLKAHPDTQALKLVLEPFFKKLCEQAQPA